MNSGFVTPTAIDVRAWLWVASFLSFVYSVLCLAARFVGKWDMLWWDDLVLGAGYMASVVHWGMLFHAIAKGLGIASIAISSSDLSFAARVRDPPSYRVVNIGSWRYYEIEALTGIHTICRCTLARGLHSLRRTASRSCPSSSSPAESFLAISIRKKSSSASHIP